LDGLGWTKAFHKWEFESPVEALTGCAAASPHLVEALVVRLDVFALGNTPRGITNGGSRASPFGRRRRFCGNLADTWPVDRKRNAADSGSRSLAFDTFSVGNHGAARKVEAFRSSASLRRRAPRRAASIGSMRTFNEAFKTAESG
jgi:hypothetical protein